MGGFNHFRGLKGPGSCWRKVQYCFAVLMISAPLRLAITVQFYTIPRFWSLPVRQLSVVPVFRSYGFVSGKYNQVVHSECRYLRSVSFVRAFTFIPVFRILQDKYCFSWKPATRQEKRYLEFCGNKLPILSSNLKTMTMKRNALIIIMTAAVYWLGLAVYQTLQPQ